MIKELKPLENPKKDFSHLMEDLINKEEVNNMILHNIKKKSVGKLGLDQNIVMQSNIPIKPETNNVSYIAKATVLNKNSNNTGIKLTKANDFGKEKREGKSQLLESDNISQSSRTTLPKKNQNKKTGSILDYIKKTSGSFESVLEAKEEILLNEGLDKIEEITEEMFQEKKNVEPKNRKRKNFMIDDGKKNLNKNKKFTK